MNRGRNDTLDLFKLFASYMVVFVHVPFYGKIGVAVDAAARFVVPLFFLVSGYYSYKATPEKIKKRISGLLRLLAFAMVVYTVYDVLYLLWRHDAQEVVRYFGDYVKLKSLRNLLLFNVPVHNVHLWYLFGVIYVYCVFLFVTKWRIPEKWMFIFSTAAIVLHLFLGEFLLIFGITVPVLLVRNFALMGLPFFFLGMFCNKYHDKLLGAPNWLIAVFVIVGVLEPVISYKFFGKNELYVGSVCILAAMVLMFVKYPDAKIPPAVISLASCGTYIYIFHPMISSIICQVYRIIGVNLDSSVALQMIHPLIVCGVSTLWAYLLVKRTERKAKR